MWTIGKMKEFNLSPKSVSNCNPYAVYSSQRITSCSAREMIKPLAMKAAYGTFELALIEYVWLVGWQKAII